MGQIAALPVPIGGYLNGYNEPMLDHRFIDQASASIEHEIAVALNRNGTGLSSCPWSFDSRPGWLWGYLRVNPSTLDAKRYQRGPDSDHLLVVLRNRC